MFEEMCVAYETRHAEAAAQLGPLRRVLKRMQKPQPAERPDALAVVTNVRAACISPCTLKLQASANRLHTPRLFDLPCLVFFVLPIFLVCIGSLGFQLCWRGRCIWPTPWTVPGRTGKPRPPAACSWCRSAWSTSG